MEAHAADPTLTARPNINDFVGALLPPGYTAEILGTGGGVEIVQPGPPDSGTESPASSEAPTAPTLHPLATPAERRDFDERAQREEARVGRSAAAQTIKRGTINDNTEADVIRKRTAKAFPELSKLDDEAVIAFARSTDAVLEAAIGEEDNLQKLSELAIRSWAASDEVRERFLQYRRRVINQQQSKASRNAPRRPGIRVPIT